VFIAGWAFKPEFRSVSATPQVLSIDQPSLNIVVTLRDPVSLVSSVSLEPDSSSGSFAGQTLLKQADAAYTATAVLPMTRGVITLHVRLTALGWHRDSGPLTVAVTDKPFALSYPPILALDDDYLATNGNISLDNFRHQPLSGGIPEGGYLVLLSADPVPEGELPAAVLSAMGPDITMRGRRPTMVQGHSGTIVDYEYEFVPGVNVQTRLLILGTEKALYQCALSFNKGDKVSGDAYRAFDDIVGKLKVL